MSEPLTGTLSARSNPDVVSHCKYEYNIWTVQINNQKVRFIPIPSLAGFK